MTENILATRTVRLLVEANRTSHFGAITEEDDSCSDGFEHLRKRASSSRTARSQLGSLDEATYHDSLIINNDNRSQRSDASTLTAKNNDLQQGLGNINPGSHRVLSPNAHQDVSDYQYRSHHISKLFCPSRNALDRMIHLVEHGLWHFFSFFFTIILLFGDPTQELWMPKEADSAFDVLYSVTFVFFITEIIVRTVAEKLVNSDADTMYFSWNFPVTSIRNLPTELCRCRVGSFMFWCDLISTLSLLYSISYINKRRFAASNITIGLGENGSPRNGLGSRRLGPGNLQVDMLIVVARTSRIASAAEKMSRRINWYLRSVFSRTTAPDWAVAEAEAQRKDNPPCTRKEKILSYLKSQLQSIGVIPSDAHALMRKMDRNDDRIIFSNTAGSSSRLLSMRQHESKVGSAMRDLTLQHVAVGIILALACTMLFTYAEKDASRQSTMIILHTQTQNPHFASIALGAARSSSIPDLLEYAFANGTLTTFSINNPWENLREVDILRITVSDPSGATTVGRFSRRHDERKEALVGLLSTLVILLVWFFGVTAFTGPVTFLVVKPIGHMVQVLGLLMSDPLGYQNTKRYKFITQQSRLAQTTQWTNEVLRGMETSFLLSTISRIGSLMKVGFGSAGAEIMKNYLGNKNELHLGLAGSTVSCIFLFCDIRQFTDTTECLQEEVFVFTNSVAEVVHSICHAHGGSANKNIGDAFLLSWKLDDMMLDDKTEASENETPSAQSSSVFLGSQARRHSVVANNFQADQALLSVVEICIALDHKTYYLEKLSEKGQNALKTKFNDPKRPSVQMGFGLHAGTAVQGALGSERKIDPTYISEAVEMAEFLESSTKKYGVKMLMSGNFHVLLDPDVKEQCRKIDQIKLKSDKGQAAYDTMDLFTYDMDLDALREPEANRFDLPRPKSAGRVKSERFRASFFNRLQPPDIPRRTTSLGDPSVEPTEDTSPKPLVLPKDPIDYSADLWKNEPIPKIRKLYSDERFFQDFSSGLESFYARKDWVHARQCFQSIRFRMKDEPSKYFLDEIKRHGGIPPSNFSGYGEAE